MKKRGRPRKHGQKSAEFFYRSLIILASFDESRATGMKYDSAIQQAVDYDVPHYLPETPISKTEAKRVVARRFMQQQKILLAKREEFVAPDRLELLKSGYILVRQYAPSQFRALNWPGERVVAFSFGIGAEPQVKRINAREV